MDELSTAGPSWIFRLLDGEIVNASPALVLAGLADGFVTGVQLAADAIDTGAAADLLEHALTMSRQLAQSV